MSGRSSDKNAPAVLDAGPPWEAVTTHFLEPHRWLPSGSAHFPGSPAHQLPQMDGVVVEQ